MSSCIGSVSSIEEKVIVLIVRDPEIPKSIQY